MKYQSVHIVWFSDRIQKSPTRDYMSSSKEEDSLMKQSWARNQIRTKLMLRIINWSSNYGIGLESHSSGYHCDMYMITRIIFTLSKKVFQFLGLFPNKISWTLSHIKKWSFYIHFSERRKTEWVSLLFFMSLFDFFTILNVSVSLTHAFSLNYSLIIFS